jgi:hypothetical protein
MDPEEEEEQRGTTGGAAEAAAQRGTASAPPRPPEAGRRLAPPVPGAARLLGAPGAGPARPSEPSRQVRPARVQMAPPRVQALQGEVARTQVQGTERPASPAATSTAPRPPIAAPRRPRAGRSWAPTRAPDPIAVFNELLTTAGILHDAVERAVADHPPPSIQPLGQLRAQARVLEELARETPAIGPLTQTRLGRALVAARTYDGVLSGPGLTPPPEEWGRLSTPPDWFRAAGLEQEVIAFRRALRELRALPDVETETAAMRAQDRITAEAQQARDDEAQWVQALEIGGSVLRVGQVAHPWRIARIHRRGVVQALNVEDGETVRSFTARDWYFQVGVARTIASTVGIARRSEVMMFLYGVVEGFSDSARGTIEAVAGFGDVLTALWAALQDLGAAARALWDGIVQGLEAWMERFLHGDLPNAFRMYGQLVGMVIFEVVVAHGASLVTASARRLIAVLRGTSLGPLIVAAEGASRAARVFVSRMSRAVLDRIAGSAAVRAVTLFTEGMMRVGRGRIEWARQIFEGAWFWAEDAFWFAADGVEDRLIRVGAAFQEWAWGMTYLVDDLPGPGGTLAMMGRRDAAEEMARRLRRRGHGAPRSSRGAAGGGPGAGGGTALARAFGRMERRLIGRFPDQPQAVEAMMR